MMTNGFGCILGGIVSGKVVEMYTQNGITDWQTVSLRFRWLLRGSGLRVHGDVQI